MNEKYKESVVKWVNPREDNYVWFIVPRDNFLIIHLRKFNVNNNSKLLRIYKYMYLCYYIKIFKKNIFKDSEKIHVSKFMINIWLKNNCWPIRIDGEAMMKGRE